MPLGTKTCIRVGGGGGGGGGLLNLFHCAFPMGILLGCVGLLIVYVYVTTRMQMIDGGGSWCVYTHGHMWVCVSVCVPYQKVALGLLLSVDESLSSVQAKMSLSHIHLQMLLE